MRLIPGLLASLSLIMLQVTTLTLGPASRSYAQGTSAIANAGARADSPARVCRWYGGNQSALSWRFDDSSVTHIERAVPLLNEYGFVGTFLVNPGISSYQQYKSEWENQVIQEGHELGDHTMTHEGALTDEAAEREIGDCATLLHTLQPARKLITFSPGGATLWMQRKPLSFFRAKYALASVGASGSGWSMSCSEDYPSFSAQGFTESLDRAIAEGVWFRPYFHPVGEGHLHISPPTFRKLLDVAQARKASFWQATMGDIYQYEQERNGARVWPHATGPDTLSLSLTSATDPALYTQPLTLEVDLPAGVDAVTVTDASGKAVPARIEEADGRRVVRWESAPVDTDYQVQAKGIGSDDRVGDVTAPGPHPYLFFTAAEAPAMLTKTSDPAAKAMWDMILREADSLAADQKPEETEELVLWDWCFRTQVLGLAYRLTHEEKYARAAVRYVMTMAASDSWHVGKTEMLSTAAAIASLGLGYDWLHDALTEAQRAQVRDAIVRYGWEPVLQATQDKEWWTSWYRCNWGAVIYGQAGIAALAILGDEPRAADWVRLSEQKIWHYTQSLGDDGGWGESVGYGSYAWSNAIAFMDAVRRVDGLDLFPNAKLRNFPYWFINLIEPNHEDYIPFSNANLGNDKFAPILFRLAREYRDGYPQALAQEFAAHRTWADADAFLFYDPTVEAKPLSDLPLAKLFPDLGWATMRSSWDDPKATLFGLKGGQKNWDHGHHDTNSFVLYAYGRPLLVDLLYPHKIWGCETEAHNTIMVNGKDQRGHVRLQGGGGDPNHRGVIGDMIDSPWYTRLVGDASLAYEQDDVKSFVREVMYLRKAAPSDPSDYFVMFDDVNATAPSQIDWLLHTYGTIGVSGDTITVTQDDAAVDVSMVAPEGFVSETFEKTLDDAGVPKPFDSAEAVRYIKVRPAAPVSRARFLSVLSPRLASTPSGVEITPIRLPNLLGATIVSGETQDLALFALDQPAMAADGVEAVGRSCFVRRSGGRVTAAALHNGQRISADGVLLFETNSAGHAVLTFSQNLVTAKLNIYDNVTLRIHVPQRPAKVLVNGEERPFEYEPDSQCVKIEGGDLHELRIPF